MKRPRFLWRLREATAASTEPALQRGPADDGGPEDSAVRDCPSCEFGMTSAGEICPNCKGAGMVMRESGLAVYYLRESVTQAYRDEAKKEGKSLADGSYPIKNKSDLRDAATLAASKHGNWQAAQRLIAKEAKAMGVDLESLPGFGKSKESAREKQLEGLLAATTLRLRESAPAHISNTSTGMAPRGDAFEVVLIREGKGNDEDGRYYTRHAVQELVSSGVAEGMQAYADHPSLDEEAFLPERSVRDLVGTYSNVTFAESGGRAEAKAIFTPVQGDGYEWVTTLAEEAARQSGNKPIVGISLYGAAAGEDRERPDGSFGPVADLIRPTSGDLVTTAGAGGEFVRRLMESARAKRAAQNNDPGGKVHVTQLMTKLRESAKRLREADTDEKRNAALDELDGLSVTAVEPEAAQLPDDLGKLKESAPTVYGKLRESAVAEATAELKKTGSVDDKDAEIASLNGRLAESERGRQAAESKVAEQGVTISAFNADLSGAKILREAKVGEDEQEFYFARIREAGAKDEDGMRAVVKQWQDYKDREQARVRESLGLGGIEGNPGSTGAGDSGLIDLSEDIPTVDPKKEQAAAAA